MAMRNRKMEDNRVREMRHGRGNEMTHREDYAQNGDYLGRRPGDVSGRNHFDEEYFIDANEPEAASAVQVK